MLPSLHIPPNEVHCPLNLMDNPRCALKLAVFALFMSWVVTSTSAVPTSEELPELSNELDCTETPIPLVPNLDEIQLQSFNQQFDDQLSDGFHSDNQSQTHDIHGQFDHCSDVASVPDPVPDVDHTAILQEFDDVDPFEQETDLVKLNRIWEQQLFQASLALDNPKPVLPWERGFAAQVFGYVQQSRPMFDRLALPPLQTQVNSVVSSSTITNTQAKVISQQTWKVVARRIANLPWRESEEKSRAFALARWRMIIQTDPNSFDIGKRILQDIVSLCSDEYLTSSIDDIFSMKATKTLLKRSADLFKYISWCRLLMREPFPITESNAYQYIKEKCFSTPSAAASFRESVAFAHGMLLLTGATDVLSSMRIKGVCNRLKAAKKPLQQAKVLTVRQVHQLEETVQSAVDIQDRVMAGYCLLCLNSRARWNDIQFPDRLTEDRDEAGKGFFQIDVRLTKTSSTAEKKAMLLPVTGILDSLSDFDWFEQWITDRSNSGLTRINQEFPLMPGVLINGAWDKAPLSTTQASKWLREILSASGSTQSEVERISTHSLKATTLSWASKFGLPLEDRKLLGYHVLDANTSALHYSRDALSGPLRKLQGVYNAIKDGSFTPDSTRSGYFSMPKLTVLDSKNKSNSSSSSSSSSSTDSSDAVLSDEERVAVTNRDIQNLPDNHKRRKLQVFKTGNVLYIHKRWRTLHIAENQQSTKLLCGRGISLAYLNIATDQTFPYVKCKDCFRQ